MILIANEEYAHHLTCLDKLSFFSDAEISSYWSEIEQRLSSGESMIFASPESISMLSSLWITLLPGSQGGKAVAKQCPVVLPEGLATIASYGYIGICPPSHYALHGIQEEPRMEMYPFLVDVDCFGHERGTLGLLLKHYDKSLTQGRFQGGCWYILSAKLTAESLDALCLAALQYNSSHCMIKRLVPEFSLYYKGERVHICCKIRSFKKELQSAQVCFQGSWDGHVEEIGIRELMLNPEDDAEVYIDWYPNEIPFDGLCTIRATLQLTDRYCYGAQRDESVISVDSFEEKIYFLCSGNRKRPIVNVTPTAIAIDGKTDFWIGTHYYPSTSFYELSYRPVRAAIVEEEVKHMANCGVRICRIWADPLLDETSIRGMQTLLEIFADHGIVAILTFFTSWVRWLEVCTADCNCRFEAVDMIDETYIGFTLRNIEQQKAYVATLARRWKDISNLIWDLTNEFSIVKDSPQTGIAEFQNWAMTIRRAISDEKASQPVIFGTSCWDTGSENYRCNSSSDIVPDHNYQSIGNMEYLPFYQNSMCRGQPFFTEEFGGTWPDYNERAWEYLYRYHVFLASGDAAALNYEWGVSWLAETLSGIPTYMKFQNEQPLSELNGFHLEGRDSYSKTWPKGTAGACPWIASPEYGCIVTASNTITPTMLVMKRISQIGENLAYIPENKQVYMLLPFETKPFKSNAGYQRYTERINHCLDTLWSNDADFEIWQEDRVNDLPESAQIVLYPNEKEIPTTMNEALLSLEKRGVRVFQGADMRWGADLMNHSANRVLPCNQRRIMRRSISEGTLYVLVNDAEPRCFTYKEMTMGVQKCCMWAVKNHQIIFAGFCGSFSYGNLSIKSDGAVYIRSKDGRDLSCSRTIELLPMTCGSIVFSEDFASVSLCDGDRVSHELSRNGTIEITEEYLPYSILIHRKMRSQEQ